MNYAYVIRNGRAWYVAQLPKQGGADWGWTTDPTSPYDPAIPLTTYWLRRFIADQLRCRRSVCTVPVPPATAEAA